MPIFLLDTSLEGSWVWCQVRSPPIWWGLEVVTMSPSQACTNKRNFKQYVRCFVLKNHKLIPSTNPVQCQDCHTIQDRHQNPCSISWLRKCGSLFQKSLYEKSKASRCDMLMVDSSFHKVELTGCKFSVKKIYLYKSLMEIETWGIYQLQ